MTILFWKAYKDYITKALADLKSWLYSFADFYWKEPAVKMCVCVCVQEYAGVYMHTHTDKHIHAHSNSQKVNRILEQENLLGSWNQSSTLNSTIFMYFHREDSIF